MKMRPKIIDRYHYLNMVPNKSAASNIFTSADSSDNVREARRKLFYVGGERSILNGEESKLEEHERICKPFDFQINEIYQTCSAVLFKTVPVLC